LVLSDGLSFYVIFVHFKDKNQEDYFYILIVISKFLAPEGSSFINHFSFKSLLFIILLYYITFQVILQSISVTLRRFRIN
jgi:hypothetical protein